MVKKQLYIIIGALLAVSIIVILIIRFIFKVPFTSLSGGQNQISNPPITNEVPQSRTEGQEIWTGVLDLVEPPTLAVGNKIYTLKILEKNTLQIFEGKGYKTGDTVNVMGSLENSVIKVSGLNKLVK